MKKALVVLMILLIFCFGLVGCGSLETADTRVIVDMGGYEVQIPAVVNKVACSSNPGADMMIAFGAGDRLTAVHKDMVNFPWFEKFYPNADSLDIIDSYEPEAESLIAMDFDIVFLPDPNVCQALREKGVCAVCLRVYNTEEVKNAAKLLGEIFGGDVKVKSDLWLEAFEESISDLEKQFADIPMEERTVVYEIIGDKYKGLYRTNYGEAQAWIQYGGGQIATLEFGGATWNNMPTEEAILATNPEVILISGRYWEQLEKELYADKKWATIDAIVNKRVYNIPMSCTDWNNYSTCYPLMNYYVFSVLYPDRVDFSLNEMAKDFYLEFYGIEFTDEEIEYMLQGLSATGEKICN